MFPIIKKNKELFLWNEINKECSMHKLILDAILNIVTVSKVWFQNC